MSIIVQIFCKRNLNIREKYYVFPIINEDGLIPLVTSTRKLIFYLWYLYPSVFIWILWYFSNRDDWYISNFESISKKKNWSSFSMCHFQTQRMRSQHWNSTVNGETLFRAIDVNVGCPPWGGISQQGYTCCESHKLIRFNFLCELVNSTKMKLLNDTNSN